MGCPYHATNRANYHRPRSLIATSLLLFPSTAEAVPSYTRRYGFDCNTCHTMWGALNAAGVTFRLSGYRAMFGKELSRSRRA